MPCRFECRELMKTLVSCLWMCFVPFVVSLKMAYCSARNLSEFPARWHASVCVAVLNLATNRIIFRTSATFTKWELWIYLNRAHVLHRTWDPLDLPCREFRPSATVRWDALIESCMRRCHHGGPDPPLRSGVKGLNGPLASATPPCRFDAKRGCLKP